MLPSESGPSTARSTVRSVSTTNTQGKEDFCDKTSTTITAPTESSILPADTASDYFNDAAGSLVTAEDPSMLSFEERRARFAQADPGVAVQLVDTPPVEPSPAVVDIASHVAAAQKVPVESCATEGPGHNEAVGLVDNIPLHFEKADTVLSACEPQTLEQELVYVEDMPIPTVPQNLMDSADADYCHTDLYPAAVVPPFVEVSSAQAAPAPEPVPVIIEACVSDDNKQVAPTPVPEPLPAISKVSGHAQGKVAPIAKSAGCTSCFAVLHKLRPARDKGAEMTTKKA